MEETGGHVHVKVEHNASLLLAFGARATSVSLCIPTAGLYLEIISHPIFCEEKPNTDEIWHSISPSSFDSESSRVIVSSVQGVSCYIWRSDRRATERKLRNINKSALV